MHDAGNVRDTYTCTIAGVPMVMMPERALYLPEQKTLLVADVHWGKAASFRASRIPLPTGTTAADLARLSQALLHSEARQLVVLGDLLHARNGRQPDTLATIAAWRERHADIDMVLVRGNHDVHAGDPPTELRIVCHDAPWSLGPFACVHDPRIDPDVSSASAPKDSYLLGGHVHPTIALTGRGRSRVRLPCFVFGEHAGILPAFSSFTGGGMYDFRDGDQHFVIADERVIPLPQNPASARASHRA